jgi:hypothetical protein
MRKRKSSTKTLYLIQTWFLRPTSREGGWKRKNHNLSGSREDARRRRRYLYSSWNRCNNNRKKDEKEGGKEEAKKEETRSVGWLAGWRRSERKLLAACPLHISRLISRRRRHVGHYKIQGRGNEQECLGGGGRGRKEGKHHQFSPLYLYLSLSPSLSLSLSLSLFLLSLSFSLSLPSLSLFLLLVILSDYTRNGRRNSL